MREKWLGMNMFRRGMLLASVGLLVVFALLYPVANRQKGIEHGGFYKLTVREDDTKVYTGKENGEKRVYTVWETTGGDTVECRMGEVSFGPYQVSEIPLSTLPAVFAHIPTDRALEMKNTATGEILFRGGYSFQVYGISLISENVKTEADAATDWTYHMNWNGVTYYDYEPVTPAAGPDCYDLARFTVGAEEALTSKGDWRLYWLGLLVALVNGLFLLFAEEIFAWQMRLRVRNVERAEPSEWELFGRAVNWCALLFLELVCLCAGLTVAI